MRPAYRPTIKYIRAGVLAKGRETRYCGVSQIQATKARLPMLPATCPSVTSRLLSNFKDNLPQY